MNETMLINSENYSLIKDFLMAVFGGYVGAIFGLLATNSIIIQGAFFIVMYYAFFALVVLLIFRRLTQIPKTKFTILLSLMIIVLSLIFIVIWLFF